MVRTVAPYFSLIKYNMKWGNTEERGTKERPLLHKPRLISLNETPERDKWSPNTVKVGM